MNPLADGAFLLSKVTITEDGEKTELLRDQMKIYSNGKFMFAFSIFWSYVWFSQFLLIYYANFPEETIYFLERWEGHNKIYKTSEILNILFFKVRLIFLL